MSSQENLTHTKKKRRKKKKQFRAHESTDAIIISFFFFFTQVNHSQPKYQRYQQQMTDTDRKEIST